MSAQHTPGPWQFGWGDGVTGSTTGPTCFLDDTDSAHEPIRVGHHAVAWLLRSGELTSEDRANARLIAAAPDLLAACQTMLPLVEEEWASHEPHNTVGWNALQEIRAAIAKATGEA